MTKRLILLLSNSPHDRMILLKREPGVERNAVFINPDDGTRIEALPDKLPSHSMLEEIRGAERLICFAPLDIRNTEAGKDANAKMVSGTIHTLGAEQFVLGTHPPGDYRDLPLSNWIDVNRLDPTPVKAEVYTTLWVDFKSVIKDKIVPAGRANRPCPEAFEEFWNAFGKGTERRFDALSLIVHDVLNTFVPLSLDVQHVMSCSDRREALKEVCGDYSGFVAKWDTLRYFIVGDRNHLNLVKRPVLPDGRALYDYVKPYLQFKDVGGVWKAILDLGGLQAKESEKFDINAENPQYRFMQRLDAIKGSGNTGGSIWEEICGDGFGAECKEFVGWVEELHQTLDDLRAKVIAG